MSITSSRPEPSGRCPRGRTASRRCEFTRLARSRAWSRRPRARPRASGAATSSWSAPSPSISASSAGADHEVLRRLGEEVVERRVDRAESQTHGQLLVEEDGNREQTRGGRRARVQPPRAQVRAAGQVTPSAAPLVARSASPGGATVPVVARPSRRRCRAPTRTSCREREVEQLADLRRRSSSPGSRTSTSTRRSRLRCIMSAEPIQTLGLAAVLEPEDPAVLEEAARGSSAPRSFSDSPGTPGRSAQMPRTSSCDRHARPARRGRARR